MESNISVFEVFLKFRRVFRINPLFAFDEAGDPVKWDENFSDVKTVKKAEANRFGLYSIEPDGTSAWISDQPDFKGALKFRNQLIRNMIGGLTGEISFLK